MGDPRKIKNKYSTPIHPWEKTRLELEKPLMKQYGLSNKKELWKVSSKVKNFKDNAKRLVASSNDQAIFERKQMFDKLKSYGLISLESLDEVLSLGIESLLDRRLQTVVFKKGYARSVKQARQMITHKHVTVNGRKVTAPGYLVRLSEENTVSFYPGSNFSSEDHPERLILTKTVEPVVEPELKSKEVVKEKAPKKEKKTKPEKKEEVKKEVKETLEVAIQESEEILESESKEEVAQNE